jgi:chromosome segregation ATPase
MQENMTTTEAIDAKVQIDTPVLEEIAQILEQNATIRILEEELMHSQQTLVQNRNELLTMEEHQALQSQKQSALVDKLEAEITQAQKALSQSREEVGSMEEHQVSQSQAQGITIDKLKEELTRAQRALAKYQDEMVTKTKNQRIVKQLKDMTATESETCTALTRAQGKVKKVQTQLEKDLEKIKDICDVYSDAINCIAPTTNYTLFLLECVKP